MTGGFVWRRQRVGEVTSVLRDYDKNTKKLMDWKKALIPSRIYKKENIALSMWDNYYICRLVESW